MKDSTYRPSFTDTARPLPFRMRNARWVEGEGGGDGGQGGTPPAGDGGTGAPPAAGTPTPADVAARQAAGNGDQQPEAGDDSPWSDPVKAKAEIERLRRENSKKRAEPQDAAKQAQEALVQQLGKALGLIKDGDDAPKPEELTQQAAAAQEAARAAQVELAVFKAAATHNGDPVALLDSRAFLAKVADLDPKAADFQTQVSDAIKAAVTENPKLAATRAVGASSVDHPGGSGEGKAPAKNLADAISRHYGS